ncbi:MULTISPECIES: hypothetical protein [Bacillaceae]|uniref:Translation initiation factor 2 n=1 Tax=Domibacillus aminovorans TaxID=29332 RepID=A0A177KXM5_9BACI|nr:MULTISPECIES: hypothetical protein [Bacillaceae]OAH57754.1 hypothetical protein AWH48_01675 [Domibacillus aminovorans]
MNKNNLNNNQKGQNSSLPENYADKLAVIASVITTFGDALATVAAVLALEEAANSNTQDQRSQSDRDQQLIRMQKQIDYLTDQLSNNNRRKN